MPGARDDRRHRPRDAMRRSVPENEISRYNEATITQEEAKWQHDRYLTSLAWKARRLKALAVGQRIIWAIFSGVLTVEVVPWIVKRLNQLGGF